MGIRIASFNMHNFSLGKKDLDRIARIILENKIDIVAMQEVLAEGRAVSGKTILKDETAKKTALEKSLLGRLGSRWDTCWADPQTKSKFYPYLGNDKRGEGYSFLWNSEKLSEELLKSLRKYPPDLSQGLLSELYKNYNCEGNDAFSPKETMILARACAALKRWENIDHIIRMLKMYELRDAISDLYSSKFNDANERMLGVVHAIQAGKNPLNEEMVSCQDSMGLTPFHYALIFSDKKSQLSAILSKKYPELSENQSTAFGNIGIYDLLTLAVFKKAPYSVLEKMILRTDEGAKQLKKVVSSLRAEGVADSVINVLLNCALTAVDTATSKGYSVDCPKEQYASMSEGREQLGKAISRTDEQIKQAQYEFYEYVANVIQTAEQRVETWRRSSSQQYPKQIQNVSRGFSYVTYWNSWKRRLRQCLHTWKRL